MIIYLDESGILTESGGSYFIVGTFATKDPRKISKAFRKWQRNKFPRKLKKQTEVKFSNSSLDDTLRIATLKFLVKEDIQIFYTFLKNRNIPKRYMKKGKVHQTGLLYVEIVASTLDLYIPYSNPELRVIRDKRTLKGVTEETFEEILTARILPNFPAKAIFKIQAIDSTSSVPVQIADWICGALARYYEKKPRGDEFYNVLKSNIMKEKELF